MPQLLAYSIHMKNFPPIAVALSLLAQPLMLVAQPVPFDQGTLPTGGANPWIAQNDSGELSASSGEMLRLRIANPTTAGTDTQVGFVSKETLGQLDSFYVDLEIDPVANREGEGFNQLDLGVAVGLNSPQTPAGRFATNASALYLNIRELSDRVDYGVFYQGQNISLPVEPSKGTGNPRALNRHDGMYRFRLVVTTAPEGSLVRVYHTQFVTPAWEGMVKEKLTAKHIGLYGRLNQASDTPLEGAIATYYVRPLEPAIASWQPTVEEKVLYSLDLSYPGLTSVRKALEQKKIGAATNHFADYFRQRDNVIGPTVSSDAMTPKEQRIADLMIEDKIEVYTGGPLIMHDFGKQYDWAADPHDTGGQFAIYNARMWPWLNMGRAYQATGDSRYAETYVKQLNSWLDQIPLRIVAVPGNEPFFIDGNTLEPPLLFTGNLGRRIEKTWWQAYELFKNAEEFDDQSLMRLMNYFQENARLVTNPSVFLAWDDSGVHMATGLLQTATMMPEWKESNYWKEVAFDRLEKTFRQQVHPDGTHASLSTGYGWATIGGYSNVFDILERNGQEMPEKFRNSIRGIIMSYMAILRPDMGNLSLNDGGWGHIDDHVRKYTHLFPNDEELVYFATRGQEGAAPEWTSRYFPNAGWFALRTGYGAQEKYLFFDGGPFGASHGKQDALQIILSIGNEIPLRNGGGGDYTQKPASLWSARTHAFNTLTPDWMVQDRVYRYEKEKHLGFNPPQRSWVSNVDFDFGQSSYDAGWFGAGQNLVGTHTRNVIFLKGDSPPHTGYWVVIDQVNPGDSKSHTWRHPFHVTATETEIDKDTKSITALGNGTHLKVLPVDPDGDLKLEIIKGQTEPVMQGWRVHGSQSREHPVPVYSWKSNDEFTKAWVLALKRPDQQEWEVESVEMDSSAGNEFIFSIKRSDGGTDHLRLRQKSTPTGAMTLNGQDIEGILGVVRRDKNGNIKATLDAPAAEAGTTTQTD